MSIENEQFMKNRFHKSIFHSLCIMPNITKLPDPTSAAPLPEPEPRASHGAGKNGSRPAACLRKPQMTAGSALRKPGTASSAVRGTYRIAGVSVQQLQCRLQLFIHDPHFPSGVVLLFIIHEPQANFERFDKICEYAQF